MNKTLPRPIVGGGRGRDNPLTTHWQAGIPANLPVKTFHDLEVNSFQTARKAISEIGTFRRSIYEIRNGEMMYKLASNVWLFEKRIVTEAIVTPVNEYMAEHVPTKRELAYIAVVLYDTEIVRYYPDGTFSVDNGNFNTPTTSTRINQFTPTWLTVWHSDSKLVGNVSHPNHLTHDVHLPVAKPEQSDEEECVFCGEKRGPHQFEDGLRCKLCAEDQDA